MFETPLNQRTVTLKLKRGQVTKLMRACTAMEIVVDNTGNREDAKMWRDLHDMLKQILDDFDEKHS